MIRAKNKGYTDFEATEDNFHIVGKGELPLNNDIISIYSADYDSSIPFNLDERQFPSYTCEQLDQLVAKPDYRTLRVIEQHDLLDEYRKVNVKICGYKTGSVGAVERESQARKNLASLKVQVCGTKYVEQDSADALSYALDFSIADPDYTYVRPIFPEQWVWPVASNLVGLVSYKDAHTVTSCFGQRLSTDSYHKGIDIRGNNVPVISVDGGVVDFVCDGSKDEDYLRGTKSQCNVASIPKVKNEVQKQIVDGYCASRRESCDLDYAQCFCHGYGKMVTIKHSEGYSTIYMHLSSINVKKGDIVSKGNQLGLVGSTGHSYAPHLHFTVLEGSIYNKDESIQWGLNNVVNPLCFFAKDEVVEFKKDSNCYSSKVDKYGFCSSSINRDKVSASSNTAFTGMYSPVETEAQMGGGFADYSSSSFITERIPSGESSDSQNVIYYPALIGGENE